MAQYLLLIYGDAERWDTISQAEMAQIDAGHQAFAAEAGSAILASGQLEPSTLAKSLRPNASGTAIITDGPFMETKEVLGGFYLIEVPDLSRATALASLLAESRHNHSGVQVHPLVDHG